MTTFPPLPFWVHLELHVQEILSEQQQHGWYFDELSARELALSLGTELREIEGLLRRKYPFVAGPQFTPKRPNKTQGYHTGATFTRLKEFNPTSRDHIAWILTTHYGWEPSQTTETGKAVIDEKVLSELDYPIAKHLSRCLDLRKKLGMLEEGTNAWLRLVDESSRLHHYCSVSTNTHRCAHRNPNLAQVPSDSEFRKLFRATPGMVMVGADLSGIELRMLAHYLGAYDNGRYADILLNGDIHQVNADKIGITRTQVKTVTYAFLYGAGDKKIGISVDKSLSEKDATKRGREVRAAFVDAINGLGELLAAVKHRARQGIITAIDGRTIKVDSQHKALNYLLQSSAGIIAKHWMCGVHINIKDKPAHQLGFIHDELQYEAQPDYADQLAETLIREAANAGTAYSLRLPIAAEARTGQSWADTH